MKDEQCEKLVKKFGQLILPKLRELHTEPSVIGLVHSSTQETFCHVEDGKEILDGDGGLVPIVKDYIFCKLLEAFLIHPPQDSRNLFKNEIYLSDVVSYDLFNSIIKASDKLIESLKNDGEFLYKYGCFLKNETMCRCDNSHHKSLVEKIIPKEHNDFAVQLINLISDKSVPYLLPLLKIDMLSEIKLKNDDYYYKDPYYFLSHFRLPKGKLCFNKINDEICKYHQSKFKFTEGNDLLQKQKLFLLTSINNSYDKRNEKLSIEKEAYRFFRNFDIKSYNNFEFKHTPFKITQKEAISSKYTCLAYLHIAIEKAFIANQHVADIQNALYDLTFLKTYFDEIEEENLSYKMFSLYALNDLTRSVDLLLNHLRNDIYDFSKIVGLATKFEILKNSIYIYPKDIYIINKIIEAFTNVSYGYDKLKSREYKIPEIFQNIYNHIEQAAQNNDIHLVEVLPILKSAYGFFSLPCHSRYRVKKEKTI